MIVKIAIGMQSAPSHQKVDVICFPCFHLIQSPFTWPETRWTSASLRSPARGRISRPLQPGVRFFQHPIPARQQHALRLACPKGRRGWVSTFHTVDPMDDLGAPFTPVVQQFRAGS